MPCIQQMESVEKKKFGCRKCPFKSDYSHSVARHMTVHDFETPYKCDACDYSSKRKDSLHRHVRNNHSSSERIKNFSCDVCQARFDAPYRLKRHMTGHSTERPFSCSLCPMAFAWKECLTSHLSTHTAEKKFRCNECSYASDRKNRIVEHFSKRHGDSQFSCYHCSFTTKILSVHRKHIEEHL